MKVAAPVLAADGVVALGRAAVAFLLFGPDGTPAERDGKRTAVKQREPARLFLQGSTSRGCRRAQVAVLYWTGATKSQAATNTRSSAIAVASVPPVRRIATPPPSAAVSAATRSP